MDEFCPSVDIGINTANTSGTQTLRHGAQPLLMEHAPDVNQSFTLQRKFFVIANPRLTGLVMAQFL
jgi:hypothetical protein